MSVKPDVPTHPDNGLNERSSSSDKQGAIERYYELLSSGHSVGGTLNTIVPIQSKSEDGDAVAVELPQSRIDETATDVLPRLRWREGSRKRQGAPVSRACSYHTERKASPPRSRRLLKTHRSTSWVQQPGTAPSREFARI